MKISKRVTVLEEIADNPERLLSGQKITLRWVYKNTKRVGKCRYWNARKEGRNGYGLVYIKTINGEEVWVKAHRLVWTLVKGKIPRNKSVLHKCDNPPCCWSKHLFTGTQKDNMGDCKRKNRHPHGDSNGQRKTTGKDVIKIRALCRPNGGMKHEDAAKKFHLSQAQITSIVRGESWSHIPLKAGGGGT